MSIEVHPEVQAALNEGRPVVALESTVISHGLPFPTNIEVATAMETIIREHKATPATIGIFDGIVKVGLSEVELSKLAHSQNIRKCSPRDLPIVTAMKEDGATTVAGTMRIAHKVGIKVFATGGIGGVHREQAFDTSADLLELGHTPMAVVCSGAKTILDLPLTLERLETEGVTVVGYGCDEFPAFFTNSSGLPTDCRVDSPEQVAALIKQRDLLELKSSILVTVPTPAYTAVPEKDAEKAVQKALKECKQQRITGKEITPFLLTRVSELTGDKSKAANIALLKSNASVAADIAVALFA